MLTIVCTAFFRGRSGAPRRLLARFLDAAAVDSVACTLRDALFLFRRLAWLRYMNGLCALVVFHITFTVHDIPVNSY